MSETIREEYNEFVPELEDIALVGETIRQLRDTRDQISSLKRTEKALRDTLIQMLDARGGRVWDENSGLEAVLTTKFRWEYDANLLRETGELKDSEIAECLVQSVDKKKVEEYVAKGSARDRMLQPARVQTKGFEVIEIKEVASTRRVT